MNLRTKAILFFGALLLSVVFIDVFYVQYGVRDTFVNQTTNNFRILAEQAESAFLTYSDAIKARAVDWGSDPTLRNLANNLLDSKGGTSSRTRFVDQFATYVSENIMRSNKEIFLIELLDKEGTVVASTDPLRVGVNDIATGTLRNKQQFSDALASKDGEAFVVSAVLDESVGPAPTTRVAVRVSALGSSTDLQSAQGILLLFSSNISQMSGVIHGDVDFSSERETNRGVLESYKTSEVFLVNSDNIIVTPLRADAQNTSPKSARLKLNTLPVSACFNEGREVSQEYDNALGVRVIGSSMCLENKGIVLIVEVDKNEIFAPLSQLIGWTTLGVVVLFILGIIMVILFVRLPLVRLDEIIEALERVMKGDLNANVKIDSYDETGRLARMFNTMIDSIRVNQRELQESKRELEEKTQILEKDLGEHEKQEKFLEESKRATLNLLEDSWKAKEKLEEEGGKLQTILSSIGDGLILIDNEYKIVLVNTKALELFMMQDDNLVGNDLRKIVKLYKKKKYLAPEDWPTEDVMRTKKSIATTVEDSFSLLTEKREIQLPVAFSVAPIERKFSGVVIVLRDVTADREFDEAKSGFISIASHQLRTPLTSIRWYSEMLLSEDSGTLNDSQKDFVAEIHGGAERLYKTVDLLLGLSRVEGGKIRVDKVPLEIGSLTSDIVREVLPQAHVKNITLAVNAPDGSPLVVWLDSLLLRQVLLNLFTNAINYTKENGKIEATWGLKKAGKEIVYSIHDDGIGIPENQKARIFSKFFRAENARTLVPDGSGLGLALVKNLVESWGGQIWFESEQDKGTTFFFTIPLTTPVDTPKDNKITIAP